jgi:beta-xylosidase
MKKKFFIIIFSIVILSGFSSFKQLLPFVGQRNNVGCDSIKKAKLASQQLIDYNFGAMLQPVPLENRFIDEQFAIWCGSVIKDKNGKFYMLYSRWPRKDGHQSWIYSSEIALAKADKPEGPYKHLKVVLPARGSKYWDGVVTHNPYITFYKGKYYLYHMGTTGTSERSPTNWWVQRNHQRIGVAVATDIEGDWKRFDKPVLSNNEKDSTAYDAMMVSNPAITFNDKGGVLMVYKQVCKNGTLKGGRVRFGVAKAKSPLGPFVKYPNTIFESKDSTSSHMEAEDPFIWFQKDYYYAIVRDVVGKFTGDTGALALMVSKNGIDWEPAKHPLVIGSSFAWADGTQSGIAIERPWVYFENGVPKFLYGAMGVDKKRSHTFNVAIPLK